MDIIHIRIWYELFSQLRHTFDKLQVYTSGVRRIISRRGG